jgi:hypothetical protein
VGNSYTNSMRSLFLITIALSLPTLCLAITDEEKENESILKVAKANAEVSIRSSLIALGWAKELDQAQNDIVAFGEAHKEFKPFIQAATWLAISDAFSVNDGKKKISKDEKATAADGKSYKDLAGTVTTLYHTWNKLQHVQKFMETVGVFAFIAKSFSTSGLAATLAATKASVLSGGIVLGVIAGGIVIYFAGKAIAKQTWGNAISFDEFVPERKFKHTTSYIRCRHYSKDDQGRYVKDDNFKTWLDDKDGKSIPGSWGSDPVTGAQGFATRESPISLIKRCAMALKKNFKELSEVKFLPQEINAMAAVSFLGTNKKYAGYPLFYYSQVNNRDGNAVKLMNYFDIPASEVKAP